MAGGYMSSPPVRPAAVVARVSPEISVARCHLGDDRDISLSWAWSVLAVDEITRAQRFHFDHDRTRYVRGRGFLRRILGEVCGQDPTDLLFGVESQGKPFLYNSRVAFNLSHSRDLAVLALSQAGPIGIDVEFIDKQVNLAELMQSCLTPAEREVVAALPPADHVRRFFAFWTAKEARMKLTGEGMSLAPKAIVLDLVAGLPVGYLWPPTPAAQAVFLDLCEPGVLCCLAVAQGLAPSIAIVKQPI